MSIHKTIAKFYFKSGFTTGPRLGQSLSFVLHNDESEGHGKAQGG